MPQSNLSKALHGRPFQMEGARFAMEHKSVLIADEPGLGKTIQSIGAVVGSKTTGSVLVVAPKTAVYVTWPQELKRWLSDVAPRDRVVTIGGKMDRKERLKVVRDILDWEMVNNPALGPYAHPDDPPVRQWILLSPNYIRYNIRSDDQGNFDYDENGEKVILPVREALVPLLGIEYGAIIVDEAHQTLAGATGNIKAQSAQSRGLRLLEIREGGLRLALSGTPFRGKHENLWGILNFLDPVGYGDGEMSYWKWIRKHFEVYLDQAYGQEIIGKLRSEKALAREAKRVMLEAYVKRYNGDPQWDVLWVEDQFHQNIKHPRKPEPIVNYVGTIDLVERNLETGEIEYVDHKFMKTIETDHLYIDDQNGGYLAIGTHELRKRGVIGPKEVVRVLVYNFLRKAKQDERPRNSLGEYLNKDGSVSKKQPARYFHRERIERIGAERNTQIKRIAQEAYWMKAVRAGLLPITKNPTRDCRWDCSFFDLCQIHEQGDDESLEYAKSQLFKTDDPYAEYRGETQPKTIAGRPLLLGR